MHKEREGEKAKMYRRHVENTVAKPPLWSNLLRAFITGGLIATLGQFIQNMLVIRGYTMTQAGGIMAITMVFLGALLTGLGVYDKIGKWGGAGGAIPITGFANSMVAPAMEFRREGVIFGLAAKMFIIAGPVLVFGIVTSIVVGIMQATLT